MEPERSPTPPPISHPIVDNDDGEDNEGNEQENDFDWFYAPDEGGYVLNFGKFRGQRMHDTSISYLLWCHRKFNNHVCIYHDIEFMTRGSTNL